MRGISRRLVPAVFTLLAAALAFPAAAATPEPSDVCGSCHRAIHRMWSTSAHAQALEDPFFLAPLNEVRDRYGADATASCLGCHAPMAAIVDDLALEKAITREGVNCEFCHGLVAVQVDDSGASYQVDIGDVKRGTIPGADSRGHEVAYSGLHADSLVCAPCHEHRTDAGVPIMTTYTEWKGSSAAENGTTCQNCHMSLVDSNVVDPRIKRDSGAQVNLHEVPGGHSLEQLLKAVRVKLKARRTEAGLEVETHVLNTGAGHAVPTGMPGRRIVLKIDVKTSGGERYEDRRVFEKQFVDGEGKRVLHVADLFFAEGLTLAEDTRIAADEDREERFVFPVPADASAWINLRLFYEHEPWGEDGEQVGLTFYSERRFVRSAS